MPQPSPQPLRGRRPRRAGAWGFRASQLATMTLPPAVIAFVRRQVIRQRGTWLRQVKQRGMVGTPPTINFQGFVHPTIRRSKKLGARLIQPGRPPI